MVIQELVDGAIKVEIVKRIGNISFISDFFNSIKDMDTRNFIN